METEILTLEPVTEKPESEVTTSGNDQFFNANTSAIELDEVRSKCIIPSFSKDNETTISHTHFIEAVYQAAVNVFGGWRARVKVKGCDAPASLVHTWVVPKR